MGAGPGARPASSGSTASAQVSRSPSSHPGHTPLCHPGSWACGHHAPCSETLGHGQVGWGLGPDTGRFGAPAVLMGRGLPRAGEWLPNHLASGHFAQREGFLGHTCSGTHSEKQSPWRIEVEQQGACQESCSTFQVDVRMWRPVGTGPRGPGQPPGCREGKGQRPRGHTCFSIPARTEGSPTALVTVKWVGRRSPLSPRPGMRPGMLLTPHPGLGGAGRGQCGDQRRAA